MERINTIKEKLRELKSLDQGFSIFGSERHRYQLHPTLSEEEINRTETAHQIVLSPEYKEILQHLGNGGAGCGYGLEKMNLKHIHPPYPGTAQLLRHWEDPQNMDYDMVELEEISGYLKLFDFGCGMEYGLIVNGEEAGGLIYFDCDGRFKKLENPSILDFYDEWLDDSLHTLKRVQKKLHELPLPEVIDSEWAMNNFAVKEMILSLIGAEPIRGGVSGRKLQDHLEQEYRKWKVR